MLAETTKPISAGKQVACQIIGLANSELNFMGNYTVDSFNGSGNSTRPFRPAVSGLCQRTGGVSRFDDSMAKALDPGAGIGVPL